MPENLDNQDVEYTIGVHIDMPGDVVQAIQYAQSNSNIVGYWGNYKITPHITIHLSAFTESDFLHCEEELRKQSLKSFDVQVKGLGINPNKKRGNIFVMLEIERDDAIVSFHKDIVEFVNKYRKGMVRTKDKQRIKKGEYSQTEIDTINRYGYSRVLKNFNPHVTIGELPMGEESNFQIVELKKQLKPLEKKRFNVSEFVIGLYPYNNNIGEFNVKNQQEMIIPLH